MGSAGPVSKTETSTTNTDARTDARVFQDQRVYSFADNRQDNSVRNYNFNPVFNINITQEQAKRVGDFNDKVNGSLPGGQDQGADAVKGTQVNTSDQPKQGVATVAAPNQDATTIGTPNAGTTAVSAPTAGGQPSGTCSKGNDGAAGGLDINKLLAQFKETLGGYLKSFESMMKQFEPPQSITQGESPYFKALNDQMNGKSMAQDMAYTEPSYATGLKV